MKILVIAGSVRETSKSSSLARAVATAADGDADVEIFPPLNSLPHFDPEVSDDSAADSVRDLRAKMSAAHGVVVVTPEYAHGYPGVLKNALDWLVGSGELAGKPLAMISSSPSATGGSMAQLSLVATLTVMGGMLVDSVTVPFVGTKLTADGELADHATLTRIRGTVEVLAETSGQGL
jgi:chromate reductase, NAD(P)H dehydrogenase (quinone)